MFSFENVICCIFVACFGFMVSIEIGYNVMICNWSNHFEKKKNHKNQGELDTAGALDLNDAILEPSRETLIARRRQAA